MLMANGLPAVPSPSFYSLARLLPESISEYRRLLEAAIVVASG